MASLERRLYHETPPPARTRLQNNPTLLVSWWCTGFAIAIILTRLGGRLVRVNRLFREDWIMFASLIPLVGRMVCAEFLMLYDTNNTQTAGLSAEDIHKREIGSKVVLASRILFAAFIWMEKWTISESFKRLTTQSWKRSYQGFLQFIRWFLLITFFATVIATLAECHPFSHYWQVIPDPGPQCREALAQLFTMGITDIFTDFLLVVFPIPIIITLTMPLKRKISLVLLFACSLIPVAVTTYRIVIVVRNGGRQQTRTLMASLEILAAAAVSNMVAIGSFLRDRGVKKAKFKFGSTTDSVERPSTRRGTAVTQHMYGSDEDLFRGVGIGLDPRLRDLERVPRPAPVVLPPNSSPQMMGSPVIDQNWQFPHDSETDSESELKDLQSLEPERSPGAVSLHTPGSRRVSFFDVGGLLDDQPRPSPRHNSVRDVSPHAANPRPPLPIHNAHDALSPRSGSHALLQDLGGLLSSNDGRDQSRRRGDSSHTRSTSRIALRHLRRDGRAASPVVVPQAGSSPAIRPMSLTRQDTTQSLQDVGGLLSDPDPQESDRGRHAQME